MTVLISRVLAPGRALAALDVDNPTGAALAVALVGADGWKVATTGGRVVADRLDQRKAKALMLRTAHQAANAAAVRALFNRTRPAPIRTGGVA